MLDGLLKFSQKISISVERSRIDPDIPPMGCVFTSHSSLPKAKIPPSHFVSSQLEATHFHG
jgi:hypothetical protein